MCVALGIQRAMRMRRIVICELPRCTKYFHIMSYKSLFSGGGGVGGGGGMKQNVQFESFYNIYLNISHSKKN